MKIPLYPYQQKGVDFLYQLGSGILGDEPGLGKSAQALALCEKVQAEKVLIFCPAVLKWQWAQEIEKFLPGNKSVVIEGTKGERDALWEKKDARFYIANYELLLRDFEEMEKTAWSIIIADEATKISNPKAKQSRAIKALRARRRIAMTGTPINNKAQDIWNLADFCIPGSLGNYWAFLARYCIKNEWNAIVGHKNLVDLNYRLKRIMIRRLKEEVLPELPEKVVIDIPFEFSPKEKELYQKIKKEILGEITKTDIDKMENPQNLALFAMVKMIRLRQLADSMELLGQNEKSSKMEVLKELLSEQNGKKVLVFSEFSEMCKILHRDLAEYHPLMIIGETSAQERQEVLKKFNEDETHRVCILSSAGQFGLNLQASSVIIHYDQAWSISKMEQREGRAHRIGQKESVMVYNLLAKGSADMHVRKVLKNKAALSDEVLAGPQLTIADIQYMLNKYE